jgi:hypothetical protein
MGQSCLYICLSALHFLVDLYLSWRLYLRQCGQLVARSVADSLPHSHTNGYCRSLCHRSAFWTSKHESLIGSDTNQSLIRSDQHRRNEVIEINLGIEEVPFSWAFCGTMSVQVQVNKVVRVPRKHLDDMPNRA